MKVGPKKAEGPDQGPDVGTQAYFQQNRTGKMRLKSGRDKWIRVNKIIPRYGTAEGEGEPAHRGDKASFKSTHNAPGGGHPRKRESAGHGGNQRQSRKTMKEKGGQRKNTPARGDVKARGCERTEEGTSRGRGGDTRFPAPRTANHREKFVQEIHPTNEEGNEKDGDDFQRPMSRT